VKSRARLRFFHLTFAFSLVAVRAEARTWHVRVDGTGDAPTIQAGIDSASAGDDVLLAAGTYSWTPHGATGPAMTRMKPAIWLHSESGAASTILDAENRGRVILCQDVGNQARIEALTIQKGQSSDGAGILSTGASEPSIVDCVIHNNSAQDNPNARGGGIHCDVATVQGCEFVGNSASDFTGGGAGGGLYAGAARLER